MFRTLAVMLTFITLGHLTTASPQAYIDIKRLTNEMGSHLTDDLVATLRTVSPCPFKQMDAMRVHLDEIFSTSSFFDLQVAPNLACDFGKMSVKAEDALEFVPECALDVFCSALLSNIANSCQHVQEAEGKELLHHLMDVIERKFPNYNTENWFERISEGLYQAAVANPTLIRIEQPGNWDRDRFGVPYVLRSREASEGSQYAQSEAEPNVTGTLQYMRTNSSKWIQVYLTYRQCNSSDIQHNFTWIWIDKHTVALRHDLPQGFATNHCEREVRVATHVELRGKYWLAKYVYNPLDDSQSRLKLIADGDEANDGQSISQAEISAQTRAKAIDEGVNIFDDDGYHTESYIEWLKLNREREEAERKDDEKIDLDTEAKDVIYENETPDYNERPEWEWMHDMDPRIDEDGNANY